MIRLITKCISWAFAPIRWWFRQWEKTNRGKWHMAMREWSDSEFVPMCHPWTTWKSIETKKHTSPKGETVCKVCAMLMRDRLC